MKWDQQVVKVNNKQQILDCIKRDAPISRADISAQLGLTKGTVSSLVNELLEANLCYESGPGESSGGRRPVILLFNEKAGFSIGIDLGVNYILGVLTDLNGEIILEQKKSIKNNDYTELMSLVKEIIRNLLHSAPKSTYGVVGIGIGVPGIVNKEGQVLFAPNLGWTNIDLKDELENEFKLPVIIENEANAGAYGEKMFGAGKQFDHIIYISAGIGIGVGFILNSELYRGSNGFSGEMGHMVVDINGPKCTCGNKGCWELYASEKALISSALQKIDTASEMSLEYLLELAPTDINIQALFKTIGNYIGLGVKNIANTFNPEQIIIGNRMAMAKDFLVDSINELVYDHSLKHNTEQLEISFSALSIYSSALGVSAHVIEKFLENTITDQG